MSADEPDGADDEPQVYYQWQVLQRDAKGGDIWHALKQKMTEKRAIAWANARGKTIRKVSSSGRVHAMFVPIPRKRTREQ